VCITLKAPKINGNHPSIILAAKTKKEKKSLDLNVSQYNGCEDQYGLLHTNI
jgi:hypothetical protein